MSKNKLISLTIDFIRSVFTNNMNANDQVIVNNHAPKKDVNGYYTVYKGVRIGLGTDLVKLKGITDINGNDGARFHCITKDRLATFGMTPSAKETGVNTVETHSRSLELRTGIKCPESVPSKGNIDWNDWLAVVNQLYPNGIPVDVVDNPNNPSEKNVQFAGSSELQILDELDDDTITPSMSDEDKLKAVLGDRMNLDSVDEAVEEEIPTT